MADNNLIQLKDTSKTILFDRFTHEKVSILTLCKRFNKEESGAPDDIVIEIEKEYGVKSFEEFLQKFKPVIYQNQSVTEDGRPIITYSLDKVQGSVPVEICKHSFYNVVRSIIDKKEVSGKANIDFDYTSISELLSPEAELKRAKRMRQELEANTEKYLECERNHRTEEAKKYFRLCSKNYKEMLNKYENNAINLLPLAIADITVMLTAKKEAADKAGGGEVPKLCDFKWDDNGNLKAIPRNTNAVDTPLLEDGKTPVAMIEENIGKVIDRLPAVKESKYMCDVLKRSFIPAINQPDIPIDELAARKKGYVDLYHDIQQNFFDTAAELIKKILNVEMFFRHAADSRGNIGTTLIVANFNLDELLDKDNKEAFEDVLKKLNETMRKKIWFAILPPVNDDEFDDPDNSPYDPDDIFGDNSNASAPKTHNNVGLENVVAAANLLAKHKIISFFNFKASEKTGFKGFTDSIYEKYKAKIEETTLDKTSAVFSYPNFTVIPKEEKDIKISEEMVNSKTGAIYSEEKYIKIPAIYIDSAFVTAGLVVATQNLNILREKKYKLLADNPPVRFNLEDDKNRFNFTTAFNRETLLSRDSELTAKIIREGFGFCYSANEGVDANNKLITNIYVQTARTCAKKQIFRKLVCDYVYCHFYYKNNGPLNGPPSKFAKFANELNDYCKRQMNEKAVNRLLYSDVEEISFKDDAIFLKFKNDEEKIDITKIMEEEE